MASAQPPESPTMMSVVFVAVAFAVHFLCRKMDLNEGARCVMLHGCRWAGIAHKRLDKRAVCESQRYPEQEKNDDVEKDDVEKDDVDKVL